MVSFKDGSYKCSNNVTKVLSDVVKKDFITKHAEQILGYTRGFDHYFVFSNGKVANIINYNYIISLIVKSAVLWKALEFTKEA